MSERRGLELSFSQLAAGALATVTATVLASFFGAYGTIIGAAASSVVSTAGAAIYQHFFRRTGDKLKEAGQHMSAVNLRSTLVSERGSAVGTEMSTVRVPDPVAPKSPDRPPRPRPESKPRARTLADVVDNTGTVTSRANGSEAESGSPGSAFGNGAASGRTAGAFGAVSGDRTDAGGPGGADTTRAQGADPGGTDDGDGDATRVDGAAREPGISGETTNLAGTADAETMAISAMTGVSEVYSAKSTDARPTFGAMLSWARGRWVVLLGGAVLVFVVVMGGVTLAEKVMNKPLSDAVRGKTGTGTSLFHGSGGQPTESPTGNPADTASPGPTDSTGPNPGETARNTPNPGRTAQQPPARDSQAPQTGGPTGAPTPRPSTTGGGATNGPNGNNAQREGQPTTPSGQ